MSSENKTTRTTASVASYIAAIADDEQRRDGSQLVAIFTTVTGHEPAMWGASIVGFDSYHYVYDSGREGDACVVGFSARKRELVLYLGMGSGSYSKDLAVLGKHRLGKGCLYIKKLADVDTRVLTRIITDCYCAAKARSN